MTTDTSHGIEHVPAPWDCTGESWWFTCYPMSGNKNGAHAGSSHPLDFKPGANDGFDGGFGMIMVIRYSSTPVGPYDELLYIPGYYKTPHASSSRYRITNIYVSSKETVYNGRKNWNIPKHLAVFNFDKSENTGQTRITVAHPETPENPFFVAVVKDIPIVSKVTIPLNTSYLPLSLEAHQPDLQAVETPQGKANGEIGTEVWKSFTPWMGGKTRFVQCLEIKNGNGDGTWPDKVDGVWGSVIRWDPGMKLKFDVGTEYPKPNL